MTDLFRRRTHAVHVIEVGPFRFVLMRYLAFAALRRPLVSHLLQRERTAGKPPYGVQVSQLLSRLAALGCLGIGLDYDVALFLDRGFFAPHRVRDMLGLLNLAFADVDFFVDNRLLLERNLFRGHRDTDRLAFADGSLGW